jgi:hypothetical protein
VGDLTNAIVRTERLGDLVVADCRADTPVPGITALRMQSRSASPALWVRVGAEAGDPDRGRAIVRCSPWRTPPLSR